MKQILQRDLNIVWAQNILLLVSVTISGALLPLYIQGAGYSEGQNGFLLGINSIGLLAALLVMGPAIDRKDCRIFIVLGSLFWVVSSAAIPFSTSAWVLGPARFLQGFGYVIFYTASLVYATRSISDSLRGTVVGIVEAIGAFSIGVTPFLAYWILARWGYPPAFWLAALIALVTAVGTLLLPPRPDLHRPVFGRAAQEANPEVAQPLAMPRTLSVGALLPGLVGAAMFFAATSFINLAPLVAQHVQVANLGLYLGVRALATVPTRIFSGFFSDRKNPAWVIIPGFVLAACAMALVPVVVAPGWVFLVPILFGSGMGLASPALTAWMLTRVHPSERATAINTFTLMAEGSGFVGTWGLGLALQSGNMGVFYGISVVLVAGLAAYLLLFRRAGKRDSLASA
jgi:MFS family permease